MGNNPSKSLIIESLTFCTILVLYVLYMQSFVRVSVRTMKKEGIPNNSVVITMNVKEWQDYQKVTLTVS